MRERLFLRGPDEVRVEAAMSCAPAGPYVIAACAVGGAIYGGFWGYVFVHK